MKRSSSQGFYKFDNDESFHGTGSVTQENGSALKEKYASSSTMKTLTCVHVAEDLQSDQYKKQQQKTKKNMIFDSLGDMNL